MMGGLGREAHLGAGGWGGGSGGKRVELPGWAVTSEPLAQLSPDVSSSSRPRLSWSSNDAPPALEPQRDLESSRRESQARTRGDETRGDETGACERVWGCGHREDHGHVCVHVCGEGAPPVRRVSCVSSGV